MTADVMLVVNNGSTSVKTRLFGHDLRAIACLTADCSDLAAVHFVGQDGFGIGFQETLACVTFADCLRAVFDRWREWVAELSVTLVAVGHRIVHGGDEFVGLTLLEQTELQRLTRYDRYAPLHNPVNRAGVAAALVAFPDAMQYGVFDTAFHNSLPEYAKRYPLPAAIVERYGLRRYGFHGIVCQQALRRTAEYLGRAPDALNMVVLHLGGGASATAISNGRSVDTSMGYSPLAGLMMASRCGDIDPMLPLLLLREGMAVQAVEDLLNHDSGLQGVCAETDMRKVLERAAAGDDTAQLAVDMYCDRVKKYLGAYCAVLGRVDALVFSGGVGEHAPTIRQLILEDMHHFGFQLDPEANRQASGEMVEIGVGPIPVLVLQANEELEIARMLLAQSPTG